MFKITEETKAAAMEAMKAILGDVPEDKLSEAFDAAANELFRNDPYEEIDKLRAKLAEAHELLHKLTAIIPGNDAAGQEVARFLYAAEKLKGDGDE